MDKNMLNWFEIPVADFERAKKFYETIFDFQMMPMEMGGTMMGFFPFEMGSSKVSGAIAKGEMHRPSMDGVIVYLNGNPDLGIVLDRVEAAGGKIMMPKTQITPEIGYMAFLVDTEGNRVGLHSNG